MRTRGEAIVAAPVDEYILVCNGHVVESYKSKGMALIDRDYQRIVNGFADIAVYRIKTEVVDG